MKILVFDTETTGLPTKRNPSIYETGCWPHIVQLSYILYDTESHKMLIEHDWIIKLPDNVNISPEAEAMHGISKQISLSKGIDIKEGLELLDICMEKADVMVGHNIKFDKQLIIVENIRNMRHSYLKKGTIAEYCTMKHGAPLCNIMRPSKYSPGETYLKFPSQSELHQHLFGTVPQGTHNSWVDILICLRCYCKMTLDIDLYLTNHKFKKRFNAYV